RPSRHLRSPLPRPRPNPYRRIWDWYRGTSDAIYQNIHLLELSQPEMVAVFGADHIYRMDISQMISYHKKKGAKGTVAALPIPVEEAHDFGTMAIDEDWRITEFHEKVANPPEIPGRPGWTLASMGNYLFDNDVLVSELRRDAADPSSEHDFGKNMLPDMIHEHPLYAYDFHSNVVPGERPENRGYWRDVGTLEAYFEASMDLRAVKPLLNLYNHKWPLRTAEYPQGPSKFTFDEEGRRGVAINSVVSEGCILAGAEVRDSILGRRVFADNGALIQNCVVMDGCHIGAGAKIRKAIIDKNAKIEPGTIIGFDEEEDRARYQVSATGIVVVQGYRSAIPVSPAAI
ncbi:MAG: sugar phosphate nucleotidyltransferase, partial [Acidobacteria bacterium]|nr:sugar phosphate nucleotidyltransferase [Acidobacteriota bacterium]